MLTPGNGSPPLDKRHLDTLRRLDAGGSVPADEMALAVLHAIEAVPDATTLDSSDSPDTLTRAAPPGVAP